MSDTLVLTIEVPGFYVEDVRANAASIGVSIEDYLEDAMLGVDDAIVIFHVEDEIDGHTIKHLDARILRRGLAVDGRIA